MAMSAVVVVFPLVPVTAMLVREKQGANPIPIPARLESLLSGLFLNQNDPTELLEKQQ